jgi:hypothetical protein
VSNYESHQDQAETYILAGIGLIKGVYEVFIKQTVIDIGHKVLSREVAVEPWQEEFFDKQE